MHQALILFHFKIRLMYARSKYFSLLYTNFIFFFQKESLILISRGHHLETSVTSKMADLEFSVE